MICRNSIDQRTASGAANPIAADHALYASALTAGLIRWEPFASHDGRGEVCVGGIRYCTRLDSFGVPEMTNNIRAAIARAEGGAS